MILLQAIDKVSPGIVVWKKVNQLPIKMVFKKVENTNYCIVLGKSLKFSLVGIQGSDITDGNKTLTLCIFTIDYSICLAIDESSHCFYSLHTFQRQCSSD